MTKHTEINGNVQVSVADDGQDYELVCEKKTAKRTLVIAVIKIYHKTDDTTTVTKKNNTYSN